MSEKRARRVCIGRITRPHGLRGQVKAWVEVDDPDTLAAIGRLELDGVPYRLLAVQPQHKSFLLSLEGVATREEAQALTGRDIWIDPARLPALPAGEYYQFEIVGALVYLAETARLLGEVRAIMTTLAHDIYVIQGDAGEYLVPAVDSVIVSVEPELRRIIITEEGLTTATGAH